MISIACLIYKSPKYADAVWNSVHEFTPELNDGRARFFFLANDARPELIEHLKSKNYPFIDHRNPPHGLDGYDEPLYIRGVYMGWNRAIQESEETCVLISSDFMFSPGWLHWLLLELNDKTIVSSKIVERRHPIHGKNERAWEKDFGDHPDRFAKHEFLDFVAQTRSSTTESGGTYGPIAIYKSNALKVGLFPEGNPPKTYGDREFVEKLLKIGVNHITSLNSVVYHFKEGEMRE